MSTFEVKVRRVTVVPHPDPEAHSVELAKVDEYFSVIVKGSLRTGDLAVYIPEQALVPDTLIEEMGLTGKLSGKARNRVKAIRLRGQLSQGICYRPTPWPDEWEEGTEVAEALGITKWIPDIPIHMRGAVEPAPDGSGFRTYTDIESLQRYPDMFAEGQHVRMCEKLHGCLPYKGRVMLADGRVELIGKLVHQKYRGEVLGVDADGNIAPSLVLNTFDNGPTPEGWLRIKFTRELAGRGCSFGSIILTPNHRVYSPQHPRHDEEGYVEARCLMPDDQIMMLRSEPCLTPLAEQVLIGKALGDGHIAYSRGGHASVQFGHQAEHADYVHYTLNALGDCAFKAVDVRQSGYGTTMVRGKTISSPYISRLFEDWHSEDHVKRVPESAITKIGPIALAFWYMDDGSLAHHEGQEDRVNIATNGFDETSANNLLHSLARFDIQGVKYEARGWRIRLNADDSEKFFLLIAPYVCSCMRYKLPERYRCGDGWLPQHPAYKQMATWQKILAVEPVRISHQSREKRSQHRYDLQTETGNYFAHAVFVHNSCHITGLAQEQPVVSSKGHAGRHMVLKEDAGNVYWRAAFDFHLHETLRAYLDHIGQPGQTILLFGEVLGVQDLKYGFEGGKIGYRAFDLWLNGDFVDAAQFDDFIRLYNVPAAPVLYEGPFSWDVARQYASGRSTIASHIREGIVIRPLPRELRTPSGDRMIAKLISPDYLVRKGEATEFE